MDQPSEIVAALKEVGKMRRNRVKSAEHEGNLEDENPAGHAAEHFYLGAMVG